MPHRTRPDQLDGLADLARRVTALETGAHPVAVEGIEYDGTEQQLIEINPDAEFLSAHPEHPPTVQVRAGVVTLGGIIVAAAGLPPEGEVLGPLPPGARPRTQLKPRAPVITETPSALHTLVQISGSIRVRRIDDETAMQVFLSPINFPTG